MPKEYIVLHHSATPDNMVLNSFNAIREEHLRRGYRDIGYHWVVERVEGRLVAIPGRTETSDGAHCPGRNRDGIGICLVGNFEQSSPDKELYRFTSKLCREICSRHPIKEIGGHRDYYNTVCPGRYFKVERIQQLVYERDDKMDIYVMVKEKELPGKLIDGQTWVPVRLLLDALKYEIAWDDNKKMAIIK